MHVLKFHCAFTETTVYYDGLSHGFPSLMTETNKWAQLMGESIFQGGSVPQISYGSIA
jgi:hypothetical protein